jgi:magnesium-transporting ATPase (P-type)
MSSVKWHSLPSADVLQRLNSSLTGLTTEQAKKRLIEYGHNAIIQKRRPSLLYILLGQLSDFMIVAILRHPFCFKASKKRYITALFQQFPRRLIRCVI